MKKQKNELAFNKILPYIFMFSGVVGVISSFALTYDKIQILLNKSYDPPCNINPILSCKSIMETPQSEIFGVPNTVLGLMAFSALFTFGFLLAGGAKVKKWVWISAQIAAGAGVLFMHYLFFQGVFRINAICPWCFAIWMITIPTFWYITLYNLRERNIKLPVSLSGLSAFAQKHHGDILVVWYGVIFFILLQHFWYYWSTLL